MVTCCSLQLPVRPEPGFRRGYSPSDFLAALTGSGGPGLTRAGGSQPGPQLLQRFEAGGEGCSSVLVWMPEWENGCSSGT